MGESRSLTYSVITPARDEQENLPRAAAFLAEQRVSPEAWVIVENGSRDATADVARRLAAEAEWIHVLSVAGTEVPVRGAPIVWAFMAGLDALPRRSDVVVNLDADVSGGEDFFARLLQEFAADPALGIAGGSCYEPEGEVWRQRHVTSTTVHGATRAYRWECLQQVLPLEERLGWDGFDELKANTLGWGTRTIRDLPFLHHRPTGGRESGRLAARAVQGRTCHYMGYRPTYVAMRALRHARDPAAAGLVWGYAAAALRRAPRYPDRAVVAYVRERQRLRSLLARARESLRHRGTLPRTASAPRGGPG